MTQTSGCPFCQAEVAVPPQYGGRQVKCPHCGGEFTAPVTVAPLSTASTKFERIVRFTFTCMRCGTALEAGSDMCDMMGRCPTCGAVFHVPRVDPYTGLPLGPAVVADDGQLPTPMHAYAAAGEKAPRILRLASGDHVIVCPRCDLHSSVDANICPRCGLPFTIEGATEAASGAIHATNGLATASFVLGLMSIPTYCFPVLGLAAVVLGATSLIRKNAGGHALSGRRQAIAGLICGAASLGLGLLHAMKVIS